MHTIIEPFRVKMTEALPITTRGHREVCLASANNNVFLLDAENIIIDLLTDSDTGAMSAPQWAALMLGDESYAGSTSWHRFENTVREITGLDIGKLAHIIEAKGAANIPFCMIAVTNNGAGGRPVSHGKYQIRQEDT
jgi:tryptophanase